jgi:aryl-alcohol dehydrogenase-like predicted oxidoreductase
MKTANVPYLDRPVSRIVCGTDFMMGQPPYISFKALDAYWEAGGRTFDSAHCYGPNSNVFGAWTSSRGVKSEVIYFDKGCHPYGSPRVSREDMRNDILQNHERLGVEYTDFFVLHRDNPEVPIGEIVDWLNEFKAQGLIGAFGGSNWKVERIQAANEYAERAGKQGFSLNNPNLSLARAQDELWKGAYTIDEAGRQWHEQSQFPLFSWSSTARGYFAGTEDPEVLRAFDNEENRARRERAREVGERYGFSPTQTALAWVLSQPFPVFALCGLRNVDNVKENVAVLDVTLTPEELRYLEHGA